MLLKKYTKLILMTLIFTLALSICSCSAATTITRDVTRINDFKNEIMAITELKDQEEIVARLEKLIHPDSGLTKETILEKAKNDPDVQGLDIQALAQQGYSIGSFSDYDLKFNDAELGGNLYSLNIEVTLGGEKFIIHLDMLSDDVGLGLYDFDISR